MIIRHHGIVELLIVFCMSTAVLGTSEQNGTGSTSEAISVLNSIDKNNTTSHEEPVDLVRSQRRAPRFDTAESSPWVRVYNRPPGSKVDSFFNYETKGNTSTYSSGEGWDSFKINSPSVTINRRESTTKTQDILRVKTGVKESTRTPVTSKKISVVGKLSDDKQTPTTELPLQSLSSSNPPLNDTKGQIVWSSSDDKSTSGWALDDLKDTRRRPPDDLLPKDGTRWKVIGDGGDDGWQVVDDKGDVEWKIEYDDGEWKVTSTGEVPVDAEWIDPEYVWGSADGSLSEEDDYNSWPADEYVHSPWAGPSTYSRGLANHSWPKNAYDNTAGVIVKESSREKGVKEASSSKIEPSGKEPIKFGARRRIPEKDTSSAQDRTDEVSNDKADHTGEITAEAPQADQQVVKVKSPNSVDKKGSNWVQGYGSKTWEVDNIGWNSGFGGETWITSNKDYPDSPWVPKSSTGQIQDILFNQNSNTDPGNSKTDNPIRAWGTGYGTKTWKGNEWDSNVVWKTGYDGALPLSSDNSTWDFPESSKDKADDGDTNPIVWSQPEPSEESRPISNAKDSNSTPKKTIRIRWPTKSSNVWKVTPSRQDENESWGDEKSEGGVIWKDQSPDPTSADDKIGNDYYGKVWKTSSIEGVQNPITAAWPNKNQKKTSNLISVKWKPDDTIGDIPPIAFNQGQWFGGDPSGLPTWIYGGCKMSFKCGPTESDTNDDSIPNTPPDVSEETSTPPPTAPTTLAQVWPIKQYNSKSWEPPAKSWKRPPTKGWKPPKKGWRPPTTKQTPSPTVPDTPTPTDLWTDSTVPPLPSTVTWPPSPPVQKKWKKPRPRPTKSWRPAPTKSWKPPKTKSWKRPPPGINWQPPIATPAPDAWSTPTKPDCKDVTEASWPPTSNPAEDEADDGGNQPQIIIITKLPGGPKTGPPQLDDKGDTKDDSVNTIIKPRGKSWVFPPRKGIPKIYKNRKDKIVGNGNRRPVKPKRKPPSSVYKGWPKGLPPPPPPPFAWPGNVKRWPTKKPATLTNWIPPKYMKSKTWKQMLRKWMNQRL